ncbi:hypothetical protein KKG05_03995, partial [bacterium]|nr:hypothetical protein [bacterium]
MHRCVFAAFFLVLLISPFASIIASEKSIPNFALTISPETEGRLDWDFDNTIFGSSRDEIHPTLCATPDGQYLYACCCVLDGDGAYNHLRLRWSTDGGLTWGANIDLQAEHPLGVSQLAADDSYIYLVYEYYYAPDDIDIYLARLPISATEPFITLTVANTTDVESSPAITCDNRDNPLEPYLYISHATQTQTDSTYYFFHLSIDRGASLHRSKLISTFQGQLNRSSITTGELLESTILYFACEGERSGERGSMVYTTTSLDFGENWTFPSPLSSDHRAFSLPDICALGNYAVLTCVHKPVPHDLDVLYSISQDSGRTWNNAALVSPGESYDTEPQIVMDESGIFTIGFIHFLAEDSSMGTVWARRGTILNPDSLEFPVTVANETLTPRDYRLGMCAAPHTTPLQGAALAWTSYFILGDTDIKFDTAWRGNAAHRETLALPSQILLEQNWPNPFNQSTTIRFHLNTMNHIELIIHNILGQVVSQQNIGFLSPGIHKYIFDAQAFPSGNYFYTL